MFFSPKRPLGECVSSVAAATCAAVSASASVWRRCSRWPAGRWWRPARSGSAAGSRSRSPSLCSCRPGNQAGSCTPSWPHHQEATGRSRDCCTGSVHRWAGRGPHLRPGGPGQTWQRTSCLRGNERRTNGTKVGRCKSDLKGGLLSVPGGLKQLLTPWSCYRLVKSFRITLRINWKIARIPILHCWLLRKFLVMLKNCKKKERQKKTTLHDKQPSNV